MRIPLTVWSQVKRYRWAIASGVVLAVAASAVTILVNQPSVLARTVDFPATWITSQSSSEFPLGEVRVTLKEGGRAELVNYPIGSVDGAQRQACLRPGTQTYSGSAQWELDGDRTVLLRASGGEGVLAATPGRFDSFEWGSAIVPLCAHGVASFVLDSSRRG